SVPFPRALRVVGATGYPSAHVRTNQGLVPVAPRRSEPVTENSPQPRTDGQPPKAERVGMWGLFFGLAGLLLPPYGVILSLFGVVQGARARRVGRQRSVPAPMAVASMFVGGMGVVLSLTMGSVLVIHQEQVADYRNCSARAHTVSTQQECDQAWESSTGLPPQMVNG